MSGVRRSDFTEAMKQEMYPWFFESYDETPTVYESLFEVKPSSAAYEQFTSAIGLGDLLEKPEGEDLVMDSPMESYTIIAKNRTFGRGTRFSYESVKDAQKVADLLKATVGTWGKATSRTKDKWYVDFFNKGAMTAGNDIFNNTITGVVTDPTGALIYDNKPFFSTTHPDRVGNTYANYSASNTLTHTNLKTIYGTFTATNNRDERGQIITLTPDTLLIPPALLFTAKVILANTAIPGSIDNDVNVLANIVNPLVWPRLTDATGWFLLKAKSGLLALEREGVVMDAWQDELNRDYFATITMRWGGAVTNWRFCYASDIASS
jgi:hypothetical protein